MKVLVMVVSPSLTNVSKNSEVYEHITQVLGKALKFKSQDAQAVFIIQS